MILDHKFLVSLVKKNDLEVLKFGNKIILMPLSDYLMDEFVHSAIYPLFVLHIMFFALGRFSIFEGLAKRSFFSPYFAVTSLLAAPSMAMHAVKYSY